MNTHGSVLFSFIYLSTANPRESLAGYFSYPLNGGIKKNLLTTISLPSSEVYNQFKKSFAANCCSFETLLLTPQYIGTPTATESPLPPFIEIGNISKFLATSLSVLLTSLNIQFPC